MLSYSAVRRVSFVSLPSVESFVIPLTSTLCHFCCSLIFQPVTVLQEIAECVEGKLQTPIQYQLNTSKAHGSGTNYVKALVKTANAVARSKNMTNADLTYAEAHVDRHLMEIFQYNSPPISPGRGDSIKAPVEVD
jgi:hypothetical protein